MYMIFVALFVVFCVKSSFAVTGSCVNITGSRLSSLCYDVVDYEYFLPTGMSQAALDSAVSSSIGSQLSILPHSCRNSLRKLACSQAFLKCHTNNFNIYSDLNLMIPVPFERPCSSVCTSVDSACMGLLSFFGVSNNCSARYDYSYGRFPSLLPKRYDSSNNPSICNAMTSTATLSDTKENYIGGPSGVCYGIVDKIYVPPASSLSSSFAVFQPPYVVQSLIERTLSEKLSVLPSYLSSECHLALKKYFCGSTFLYPHEINFLKTLLSSGISIGAFSGLSIANRIAIQSYYFELPSYPSQDVCLDYQSKCSGFIAKANNSALVPSCDAMISPSIAKFPSVNQTISAVVVGRASVHFTTPPNSMSTAVDGSYETKCPGEFVVPDDPSDPAVRWITGTGCAVGCRSPIWTPQEWDGFFKLIHIIPLVGLPFVVVLLLIWIFDPTKRKQYLIISFAVTSLLGTLRILASSNENRSVYCKSNAVGIQPGSYSPLCSSQVSIMVYTALACCLAWSLQSVDLYLKLIHGANTKGHFWLYISAIFIGPLIPTLYVVATKSYGYTGVLPWCSIVVENGKNTDFLIMYFPILLFVLIGLTAMVAVIVHILRTSTKVQGIMRSTSTRNSLLSKSFSLKIGSARVSPPTVMESSSESFRRGAGGASNSKYALASTSGDEGDMEMQIAGRGSSKGTEVVTLGPGGVVNSTMQSPTSNSRKSFSASDNNGNSIRKSFSTNENNAGNRSSLRSSFSAAVDTVKRSSFLEMGNQPNQSAGASVANKSSNLKVLRTPAVFVVMFLIIWVSIFVYRGTTYFHGNAYQDSLIEWISCVFKNYDGVSDDSWLPICGKHASYRMSLSFSYWTVACVCGQSILISVIFLYNVGISTYVSFLLKNIHFPWVTSSSGGSIRNAGASPVKSNRVVVVEAPSRTKNNGILSMIDESNHESTATA